MHPIAKYHCSLTSKFGVPRQSGIAKSLIGQIVFEPEYRNSDALRGLEDFDYLWIIWLFSENRDNEFRPTVRPPRLGGNKRMGVFATRSPYHPNGIGLSSVKIERIGLDTKNGPVIYVSGADLMDGTPVLDIKPYVEYADAHTGVRSGFVDQTGWKPLEVVFEPEAAAILSKEDQQIISELLSQDPRPHYHNDPKRVYAMPYNGRDIRFWVEDGICHINY